MSKAMAMLEFGAEEKHSANSIRTHLVLHVAFYAGYGSIRSAMYQVI